MIRSSCFIVCAPFAVQGCSVKKELIPLEEVALTALSSLRIRMARSSRHKLIASKQLLLRQALRSLGGQR